MNESKIKRVIKESIRTILNEVSGEIVGASAVKCVARRKLKNGKWKETDWNKQLRQENIFRNALESEIARMVRVEPKDVSVRLDYTHRNEDYGYRDSYGQFRVIIRLKKASKYIEVWCSLDDIRFDGDGVNAFPKDVQEIAEIAKAMVAYENEITGTMDDDISDYETRANDERNIEAYNQQSDYYNSQRRNSEMERQKYDELPGLRKVFAKKPEDFSMEAPKRPDISSWSNYSKERPEYNRTRLVNKKLSRDVNNQSLSNIRYKYKNKSPR